MTIGFDIILCTAIFAAALQILFALCDEDDFLF